MTTRYRTAFAGLAFAAVTAAGCGGSRDATQGAVQDDVANRLAEVGYVAERGAEPIEVDENDAEDIGTCVARTMFENTDDFTPEERNAATSANDGDEPDPDLVAKIEALVQRCYDEVAAGGASGADDEAPTSREAGAGDEETTTTTGG